MKAIAPAKKLWRVLQDDFAVANVIPIKLNPGLFSRDLPACSPAGALAALCAR